MVIKSFKKIVHLNEAIQRGLDNLANQGILTTDAQLNIHSWNHWLEIHSGLSTAEMVGCNLLDIYPELIQRRLDRFYHQALKGQVVVLSQRLHGYLLPMPPSIAKSVSPHMLQSVRIGPLTDGSRIIGTITVIDDVTERVEREAELQHQIEALEQTKSALVSAHARLQHLVSSNPAIVYTRKPAGDGGITFISDNVTAKLGYQPQEFIENPRFWDEHIHPDDAKQLFAIAIHLFQHQHHIFEYRFLHQDGTYRWMRDEMKLVYNQQGNLQEIVGAWYDITENKQAQEQVREQAALLDIATDAILVQDFNHQILFWNKSAERLYGWDIVDAVGKNAVDLLYPETSQLEPVQKNLDEKGEWQGELRQVSKDGKEIIVESRWTLVCAREDRPKSILVVNTDITQKKQLEAQFLRAQRLESIGTLASGIAHDLNNVLGPIMMIAQLLQTQYHDERSQRLLPILVTNTKRGTNLVKQVLSFARGLGGQFTILQIKHLIWEIKQIAVQTFPKSIEIETDLSESLWAVSGDATQLDQVLMNLSVNARDAMPKGGTLKICAENIFIDENQAQLNLDARVGSYVLITVSDTGCGIPPELLERIYEPFFTTKEVGQGTGLGLPTVLSIVKNHGGFVDLCSQVGKGTQFKVYLPAVKEDEVQQLEDSELITGQGEFILVVDDEVFIREITEIMLKKSGYRVLTASNGINAVELYTQYQDEIDVVLLDMMMPSMDGPNTIYQLQKINPSTKIIATSGLAFNVMLAEAADLGVKTFLSKPYSKQELLKTIRTCLSRDEG
ncbi:MAG TPA: hybrid sensor histidine kinase/response regulator [Cyanobacteria bacterium UBA8803]|nr:hybrid sensor histidine kinase/response regulator [Cyanobacteria bacterium UBA9273]HBL62261.1 hybrid sensor histidine kinase/response regulator [Cyanobacteria bacterium UBA8803]